MVLALPELTLGHPTGGSYTAGQHPLLLPAGCTGALAYELAQEYPRLQVTVFDRPEVIELAGRFQPEGPQTGRIRFLPGQCGFVSAGVGVRDFISVFYRAHAHVCRSVSACVCLCASVCVCVCVCVCMSAYASVCVCLCLSVHLSVCLSICVCFCAVCMCTYPCFLCICVCVYIGESVCLCLCVKCMSACITVSACA